MRAAGAPTISLAIQPCDDLQQTRASGSSSQRATINGLQAYWSRSSVRADESGGKSIAFAPDTVAVLSVVAIPGATSRPLRADQQRIRYALGSSWRRSKYQAASRSAMLAITALDQSPGPRTGGSQSLSEPLPNFLAGSRWSNALIQQPTFPVIPCMAGSPHSP